MYHRILYDNILTNASIESCSFVEKELILLKKKLDKNESQWYLDNIYKCVAKIISLSIIMKNIIFCFRIKKLFLRVFDPIYVHCMYIFQTVRVYELNNCTPSFVNFDTKSVLCRCCRNSYIKWNYQQLNNPDSARPI